MTQEPLPAAAALQRWNVVQAVVWPSFLLASCLLATGPARLLAWLSIAALAAASYAWLVVVLRAGARIADRVTIARFLGMLVLCGLSIAEHRVTWLLWLGLVAAIAADLADGWAARRFGGSEAGAVLDMETDQLATLGLAVVAWGVAGLPAWVLALPGCRWLTVLVAALRRQPAYDPKPRDGGNRQARLLCALMLALALASLLPAASAAQRTTAAALAVLVLAWSHGSDLVFAARRARLADLPSRVREP